MNVEPRNGYAITALSLALVGVVFSLVPLTGFLAVILGALAVLFGLLNVGRLRRGSSNAKWMTRIALLIGVVALALGVYGITIVFNTVDEIDREIQEMQEHDPFANFEPDRLSYQVSVLPLD